MAFLTNVLCQSCDKDQNCEGNYLHLITILKHFYHICGQVLTFPLLATADPIQKRMMFLHFLHLFFKTSYFVKYCG